MKWFGKRWIGYAVGVLILIILVSKVDLSLLKEVMKGVKAWFLVPLVVLRVGGILLKAVNVQVLLKAVKQVKIYDVFKYELVNFVGSAFIPFSASVASVIYFLKKRDNINARESVATLFVDKTISFILAVMVVVVGVLKYKGIESQWIMITLFGACVIGIFIVFYTKWMEKVMLWMIPKKHASFFPDVAAHYRLLWNKHKNLIMINGAITAVSLVANGLIVVAAFKMLSFDIGFIDAFLLTNMVQLATFLHITPGGIGVKQAVGTYLYGLIGIPLTVSVAMYVILEVIRYALACIFSVTTKIPMERDNKHEWQEPI